MDLAQLSADIVPYVTAAVGAYGGAVVKNATDSAVETGSDATVTFGRRLLARLFVSARGEQVASAVQDLADEPDDETSLDLVRAQIRKALAADPALAEELAAIVRDAGGDRYSNVEIRDSHGFQIGSHNTQTNHF